MSTVRVGSNEKYAEGWDKVFGGKRKPAGKKAVKKAVKKSVKKKAAPKKKKAKRSRA